MEVLERIPALARVYSRLSSFAYTCISERYWAARPSVKSYWENRNNPGKLVLSEFLVSRLDGLGDPPRTILEVGCASGDNLYLLAKRLPNDKITGLDINRQAVTFGNKAFISEGIRNTRLVEGDIGNLRRFGKKDLVFTFAVLTHIPPNKIVVALKELLRVSSKLLIWIEPHTFGLSEGDLLKKGILLCDRGSWIRDYEALLSTLIPSEKIKVSRMPVGLNAAKPWDRTGAIIEVDRGLEGMEKTYGPPE